MTSSPLPKQALTLGGLVRRRLREVNRSAAQLAEAVQVPSEYIDDLITGARRPPLPARTDIYPKMTSFLRLSRNDLTACASAERAATASADAPAPAAPVRRLVLDLCEPETARTLEQRRGKRANAELTGFIQRLLEVTQGAVLRLLDDQISLRLAANERGTTYMVLRLKVLEFLDLTADTLTTDHFAEFVRPRIARWDVDLETGVLRVSLRSQEPRQRPRAPRAPASS